MIFFLTVYCHFGTKNQIIYLIEIIIPYEEITNNTSAKKNVENNLLIKSMIFGFRVLFAFKKIVTDLLFLRLSSESTILTFIFHYKFF